MRLRGLRLLCESQEIIKANISKATISLASSRLVACVGVWGGGDPVSKEGDSSACLI